MGAFDVLDQIRLVCGRIKLANPAYTFQQKRLNGVGFVLQLEVGLQLFLGDSYVGPRVGEIQKLSAIMFITFFLPG